AGLLGLGPGDAPLHLEAVLEGAGAALELQLDLVAHAGREGGRHEHAAGAQIGDLAAVLGGPEAREDDHVAGEAHVATALVLGERHPDEVEESPLDVLEPSGVAERGEPSRPRPTELDVLQLVDELLELVTAPLWNGRFHRSLHASGPRSSYPAGAW